MLFLWIAVVAAAAALVWVLRWLWRVLAIGAAYRSKVLCSIVFGTNRTIDPQRVEDVTADSYWVLRLFRSRVNPAAQTVTTSLLGLRPRTAVFRPGLGATLMVEANLKVRTTTATKVRTTTDSEVGTTASLKARTATAVTAPLQRVADAAFTEPNPKRRRRTRAIVVVHDDEIVAERYADGFDVDTRFAGWSMTKSVLNALVGILVREKRLLLDANAVLPEWHPPDSRAAITVEDLLRMRTGLRFSELYEDFSSDVIEMLFNQPDAAAYAARQPLSFAPGTAWSYASGTSNILSLIVRRIVGESEYWEWPRRVLFDPLGMTSAIMEPDASGTFVGSSFMLATARDWARFGQLFVHDGVWNGTRMLPEGWIAFSTTPTRQSLAGNYGAHWWLKLGPELGGGTAAAARIPADAFFAIGHEAQILTIVPSRRLVVVRLGLSVHIDAWNHAAFLAELLDAL